MENKDIKLENQLSEEQLNELIEVLDKNSDPATEALNKVLAGEVPEEETEAIENMDIDNMMEDKDTYSPYEDKELLEMLGDTPIPEVKPELNEAVEEQLTESLGGYGLSDSDTMDLLDVIRRYRAGENFSVYNALPDGMKALVNKTIIAADLGIVPDARIRNMFAKNMLDEFVMDANIDKEFDDFERRLKEELKIPNMMDMYSEHTRETMEDILPKKADEMEEQFPETAANIRRLSANFTSSYKFDKVIDTLLNNRKARTRTIKDLNKFKRFVEEFNFIASKSNIKIEDMENVAKNLVEFLAKITDNNGLIIAPWISDEYREKLYVDEVDAAKVIILVCKTCKSLTIGDIFDTSLMYYTVKNISSLAHVDIDKPTDFSIEIANNILMVISKIRDVEDMVEENRQEMNKKKRG